MKSSVNAASPGLNGGRWSAANSRSTISSPSSLDRRFDACCSSASIRRGCGGGLVCMEVRRVSNPIGRWRVPLGARRSNERPVWRVHQHYFARRVVPA